MDDYIKQMIERWQAIQLKGDEIDVFIENSIVQFDEIMTLSKKVTEFISSKNQRSLEVPIPAFLEKGFQQKNAENAIVHMQNMLKEATQTRHGMNDFTKLFDRYCENYSKYINGNKYKYNAILSSNFSDDLIKKEMKDTEKKTNYYAEELEKLLRVKKTFEPKMLFLKNQLNLLKGVS